MPSGHLRYLAGIEAHTGLVLITWTASFLYIEMQRINEARRAARRIMVFDLK
jgi:hypothetical protein